MVDSNKLRGIMAERGVSEKDVANAIGMHQTTFCDKLSRGVFGADEIDAMIAFLQIDDPMPVFFNDRVTL